MKVVIFCHYEVFLKWFLCFNEVFTLPSKDLISLELFHDYALFPKMTVFLRRNFEVDFFKNFSELHLSSSRGFLFGLAASSFCSRPSAVKSCLMHCGLPIFPMK